MFIYHFQYPVDTLKPHHAVTLFIETLAGYILASHALFRLWVVIQNAHCVPTPKYERTAVRSSTFWQKAFNYGVVLSLLASEFALLFYMTGKVLSSVVSALFCSGFRFLLMEPFREVLGLRTWHARRDSKGDLLVFFVEHESNKKQKAALLAGQMSALAVMIGAFQTNHLALTAIISTTIVYSTTHLHTSSRKSISMRGVTMGLLGLSTIILLVRGLILFTRRSSESTESAPSPLMADIETYMDEKAWIFTSLFTYPTGILIALCFRFDYQRHVDCSANASKSIPGGESVPKRKGVAVSHTPPLSSFPKIYYATAITAWSVAHLGFLGFAVFTDIPLERVYVLNQLVWCLGSVVMCPALIAVASMRGEWNSLWEYREEWSSKLEEKDSSSPNAALPMHETKGKQSEDTVAVIS